jgi:hypothetical protein
MMRFAMTYRVFARDPKQTLAQRTPIIYDDILDALGCVRNLRQAGMIIERLEQDGGAALMGSALNDELERLEHKLKGRPNKY